VNATRAKSAVLERLTAPRAFLITLAVALALPLGLSKVGGRVVFGLPLVHSGDEPHYLVTLNSLLEDRDLVLGNQYQQALGGSLDAGRAFAGQPLDHHTVWFSKDGVRHHWFQEFEVPEDAEGTPTGAPHPRQGITPEADRVERSTHPPGLVFLLAPLLYPFRGTRWVEHLALFVSPLVIFATALFVREIFRIFSASPRVVIAATLVTILGSPLWHYARTFFTEPWLALFSAGALALAVRRNAYFFAGLLIAAGMQMKPPFLLIALPLVAERVFARDVRSVMAIGAPLVLGAVLVLAQNQIYFGSPVRSAQAWGTGNPIWGLLGLLTSFDHGLFPFAPAAAVALFGWRDALRGHRRESVVLLATFGLYLMLMALWHEWRGGYCYGPRLIVPVIAFVFVGLVTVFDTLDQRSVRVQRAVVGTIAMSVVISAMGAVGHIAFWGKHPLIEPFAFIARHTG